MPREQIVIGALIALLSVMGIASERWLLANTRKGQTLVRRFGEPKATWVLRGLLAAAAIFGTLLALNVIRPVNW